MPGFSVTPSAVTEGSARLGGISGQVDELHGRIGAHTGAADGTPAAGAMVSLLGQWAQVLPHFALAGDRLAAAVAAAARGYERTDAEVGASAQPASEKRES